MLFNSYLFLLVFLPLGVGGYRLLFPLGEHWRIAWLLIVCFAFYLANDVEHLPLLIVSIILNFLAGTRIAAQTTPASRRWWLSGAIAANIGLLIFYKYVPSLPTVMGGGLASYWPTGGRVLPLGISFYTFTQIAFLIDCSRRQVKSPRLTDYGIFISWFPHLVAGPLLSQRSILPQLRGPRVRMPRLEDYTIGVTLLSIGLFKKVVLADSLANIAGGLMNVLGGTPAHETLGGWIWRATPGLSEAWIASVAYMLVVYFDFSGYSDMAMGISRMFAIDLPVNFYSPFKARNPADFWRRWHMTLGWFIRTYVYFSFASRRGGSQYLLLMVIMTLVGIWHGSTWNYLLEGLYQGFLLSAYSFWRSWAGPRSRRPSGWLGEMGARGANFIVMMFSAGLFYFHDLGQCLRFYANMVGAFGMGHLVSAATPDILLVLAGLGTVWFLPNSVEIVRDHLPRWSTQQAPIDKRLIQFKWSPSLGWAILVGAAAALALVAIPHTTDFVYNAF